MKNTNRGIESRHSTRNHVFNIIFQVEFLSEDTIFDRLESYYKIIEIEEKLEIEENKNYKPYIINKDIIFKYVTEIYENISNLDKIIEKYSIGWETSRISKVDLAILRIAIYEIMFNKDIPNKVAINEAVEFAKYYSLENSSKFINGILAKVLEEANEKEVLVQSYEK